ncbi:MAG TPA: 2-amino-4-hydroxy-6-hydroxymethyldihydropteridine diphosphokinase [Candidatus Polarisedimenticolia bacterium]|jgi:2-amino-4-hydroxy-6-hydroxymethyldihydropteridine diphosphokinase|nr:2-amino-4-hydroxy-6-hydroxymethyldihydropteridine diphosphokinase [Candidatus Polarisedimenticolia bacterium]
MAARGVFIGLGSNIGDRRAHLDRARNALGKAGLKVSQQSSLYRTDPVEVVDQEEFINQVVGCETGLGPEAILEVCLAVERSMGRVRTRDKGPRVIDLDLLLSGNDIRSGVALQVPHPRMHLRRFVLVPLAEISPGAWHPVLNLTAAELLAKCPDRSRVERVLL